jgi:hypothetical protein
MKLRSRIGRSLWAAGMALVMIVALLATVATGAAS